MTSSLTFETPGLDGSIQIEPNPFRPRSMHAGSVALLAHDGGNLASVELGRPQAVAAALHMIACALGESAALAAEKTLAPFMSAAPRKGVRS